MPERIALTVNGEPVATSADHSVASCVLEAQGAAFRRSVTGQSRGPLCGMGVCFECRLTIDGVPHQRSCQMPCRAGLQIETAATSNAAALRSTSAPDAKPTTHDVDILVVGAGPGGIAAASCAREAGARVAVIDDNPHAGGQIWRRDPAKPAPKRAAPWLARLQRDPDMLIASAQILGSTQSGILLADAPQGLLSIRYRRLILACGARERFLPFDGWTLPGVYGAGGLQALVKSGFDIRRKKVVVAGSGPLLLAVAAYLRQRGATVSLIAEQTPRGKMARFGGWLLRNQPGKIVEALGLGLQLGLTPYRAGCWPIRANGSARVESVTLTDGTKTWTEACDALACGFGLVPNLELPLHLGCAIEHGFVRIDEHQQTSVPGIYAVGELTGIGGLDKALLEGQIAGWTAADRLERATSLLRPRDKTRRFVSALDHAFALRDELRNLAMPNTIVCRCEDVTLGQLAKHANWRDAKLQTRCGMGPCQGRICGPAANFLFGWTNDSIRPPLFPTALGNLVSAPSRLS